MPLRSDCPCLIPFRSRLRAEPAWLALVLACFVACARPAWAAPPIDVGQLVSEAQRFEHGEGVARDLDRAFDLYCVAALMGHSRASYELGWMYANGRGVERNDALAAGWLRHAAAAGDRFSHRLLRRMRSVRPKLDPACPMHSAKAPVERDTIAVWVRLLAPYYDLEPELVLALIDAESGFDPTARSPKGAQGLMQLIPATARRFGVEDPWRPLDNLRGGMAYLRWLLDRFEGDVKLALAGYNAGENAVARYRGIPPYRETRSYVKRITRAYRVARSRAEPPLLPVAPGTLPVRY
jgi:hypothetical protein